MITAPTAKRLPGMLDVTHLMTMMFGADTTCKSRKVSIASAECAIVALYLDNEGALKRILTCDLAFANSAGAALTAIPAPAANHATKSGKIADNVFENLAEVMNVAVNLFTESFGGRLELGTVSRLSDASPAALAALASEQRMRIDVVIPKYDVGRVDLISV